MSRPFIAGLAGLCFLVQSAVAQTVKKANVPAAVQSALIEKYPEATHVIWEKEKDNFEANWGGKSNEDNSAVFTPAGQFVEIVVAIPISSLPAGVAAYVQKNYSGSRITEAGKVTDASGQISYEAEVKGKDMIFDKDGRFIKKD